ncbi:hypothetical protein CLV31_10422 [Algoriphagus aquaeductus]|uniref:Uncharacterized protein n=1 Tax=Algoriphagus aquaeductus TaxID=475299 RepID=A0A326RVE6_9BACT|nr:hypothetical protein CLV31_10422 [Algoriphagus aquaeductus]
MTGFQNLPCFLRIICFLTSTLTELMNFLKKVEIKNSSVLVLSLSKYRSPVPSTLPTRVGKSEASDPLIKANLVGDAIAENHGFFRFF